MSSIKQLLGRLVKNAGCLNKLFLNCWTVLTDNDIAQKQGYPFF
jgi:hypothetical protein